MQSGCQGAIFLQQAYASFVVAPVLSFIAKVPGSDMAYVFAECHLNSTEEQCISAWLFL